MSGQVKIVLYIGTGFAGVKHEDFEYVDRAEWEEMDEAAQEAYLEQAAIDYLHNHIDYSASVVEEE